MLATPETVKARARISGSSLKKTWLATGARPDAVTLRLLLMVGFCGGFTTFSSFSLQTLELLQQGAWLAAWGNMLGSVALCMGAVTLGWTLGRG